MTDMPVRRFAHRTFRAPAIAVLALVIASATLAQGCGSDAAHDPGTHDQGEPVAVRAMRADGAGAMGGIILPGRVKARQEVTLVARITGRLTTLAVREGAGFRRGQVLARLDAPEARDAVRSARDALASALARLVQARDDEARMTTLLAKDVAAERDLELARVERHAAEAAHSNAKAELESWLENTALTAPFDGVVSRRHVDRGQTLTPGQPILDLRTREVGEIEASVPESALPSLEGATVTYQIGDGGWHAAELARIDGMTDPTTRTRLAAFRPLKRTALEAGAYVRLRLHTNGAGGDSAFASQQPLIVPSRSLIRRGSLTGVYVLRDDRAWLRWLRVGREADGRVEVLSGLTSGDVFAADPAGLADGRRVRMEE
jgi:RND family efflux transporter MFP subunit